MNYVVKIKDVSHFYKKTKAVDNITLDIPSGCIVGLIGPDGVGKSTLLSIIAGVRKIQSGNVEVLGGDIKSASFRKKISSRIAYMPQGLGKNLYMLLSVYENLEFFGRLFGLEKNERKKRIDELLKSIGLYEFKDRAAGKLSGGMKQKLGLCCALIHDPDLLILDEPTTGVDPLSRREFWKLIELIRKTQKEMSVLIATAYMQEAELFDYTVAMNDGKILANTTPAELLKITKTDNIDSAFIELLPKKQTKEHRDFPISEKSQIQNDILAIEAFELTMKFGDFTAVENVSFKIKQGEIFGFLGSNGCGKTTTMKMLTGLLIPTHGDIRLFETPIKGHNLEMRKDVGYMTQSFSLYNELTIKQNLFLHAHLYQIEKSLIDARVEEMLERFYIKKYEDALAHDLPLGIKQRLSLAVAVIHKPKMLILDEPTSGVDPISRDMFWKFLIDLSREDGVTIFISTHFMNEGERCDRVSLMHQGRVLASDTPQALAESKDKENLEDAFVEYLYGAMDKEEMDESAIAIDKSSHKEPSGFFSLLRFFGYAYRESLELVRDPVRLVFALLGTVILMFVMGYGISMDVEDLKFSVLDNDQSPQSREYVEYISGSRYFLEQEGLTSYEELDEKMKRGEIALAIEIPPNFGRDLKKGSNPEVGAWIDGTISFRAETIKGYMEGLHGTYLSELSNVDAKPLVGVEMRYRYNQDFESLNSMVPAVIPILLVFIPSILMALSVVREKELGSITNFYATPVRKLEFLLGKQLPYIFISMISFLGLMLLAVYVFKVPVAGNFAVLFFGALLFVSATTGLGFLMSSFAKTQIAALGGTAIATMLPTVSFSGLRDPVSSLEGVGAFIGNIFPATYFINISRGIFSKDIGFEGHYFDFVALALSIVVITSISLMLLKKQER
ncbi:ribosome-associated ATPase/putative transporter RbbA [Sulfurimonas sp.]|uniref:ribosome-associated ATPase/putative transporter RbbA n=1 Tax=Sulfurimonas sp. TaxID=2022749 RepID=UPI0019EEBD6E|nr:ribosome-associated ATPase/putative transporter RbbA [Sulfurimonas sp.]MBE0514167.1 ribosome-associated ATPase/putative transporter RbbA [Sulfurimonas sp.]